MTHDELYEIERALHRAYECDDGCRFCYAEGKAPWRRRREAGRDDPHDWD